jgi:hypothetical protein
LQSRLSRAPLVEPYLKNCNTSIIRVIAHSVRLHLNPDGVLSLLHMGDYSAGFEPRIVNGKIGFGLS